MTKSCCSEHNGWYCTLEEGHTCAHEAWAGKQLCDTWSIESILFAQTDHAYYQAVTGDLDEPTP